MYKNTSLHANNPAFIICKNILQSRNLAKRSYERF